MNQDNQYEDPKLQGRPPPYTSGPPPVVAQPPTMMQPLTHNMYQPNMVPVVVPMVVGQQMSPKASSATCVSCNQQIVTRVESKATMRTHMFALLLCFMGCWPCVFIPYCIDSCRNTDHYCPNCNAYIGSYVN